MKLYTVAVYDLRLCMKENNPLKGDNQQCKMGLIVCDLTNSSCFLGQTYLFIFMNKTILIAHKFVDSKLT